MKKKNIWKRTGALILSAALLMSFPLAAFAAERETTVTEPAEGKVLVAVKGTFTSDEKDAILKRINEIREEAQGDKYVEMKWSSDLEWIAQTRAAEASVFESHTRPNGTDWNTVEHGGVKTEAENLAWNAENTQEKRSAMMEAIELWYAEKEYAGTSEQAEKAGHYLALINPDYKYIGLGTFQSSSAQWAATAAEFSTESGLNGDKLDVAGVDAQVMEVKAESLSLAIADAAELEIKGTEQLTLTAKVVFQDAEATEKVTTDCALRSTVTWTSSDEKVATVDENGLVTAVSGGKAEITATVGMQSAKTEVTVKATDPTPTPTPSPTPTAAPSAPPSTEPSKEPEPSTSPSTEPSKDPEPSASPSTEPSKEPEPNTSPSAKPSEPPVTEPSEKPGASEEPKPSAEPSEPVYKLEVSKNSVTVTEALKKAGLDTEEKIKAAFEALWKDEKIEGVQYLDVKLQVSEGGKETWNYAGADAYKDGGKYIGLAYPEGADKNDTFVIYHMYAEDMPGHKAGDIEVIEGDDIGRLDTMLTLTVSGFSPFAIVWKAAEPVATPTPTPEPTATPTPASTPTPAPTTAPTATPVVTATPAPTAATEYLNVPPTGDSTPVAFLCAAAAVSALGLAFALQRRRRNGR